ncbi:MAG: hypothetical protein KDA37_15630 [Planctomycetales bacterium]|nr:hypothetical protein [Planctomycetales bacterium]
MAPIFAVFVIAIIVLVIVGIVYSHHQAKKRREALTQIALARGWRFEPRAVYRHDERYRNLAVFQQGSGRYAHNRLLGALELLNQPCPLDMGDYHYETHSTDSKGNQQTHHHRFSYLVVQSPLQPAPEVTIRPEGFFDSVSAFFGFDDIDFESKEFSDRFHVKCKDKRFAYDLMHPRMMEFLMHGPKSNIEIDGRSLCVTDGAVWKPEQFERYAEWARRFFELWPRHLMEGV